MRTISILLILFLLVGCKKPTASTVTPSTVTYNQPGSNMTAPIQLTDSMWNPTLPGYIAIAFGMNGTYYEDQINIASIQGSWYVRSPDSIIVAYPTWTLRRRITKCTADTLRMVGVGNSVYTYVK